MGAISLINSTVFEVGLYKFWTRILIFVLFLLKLQGFTRRNILPKLLHENTGYVTTLSQVRLQITVTMSKILSYFLERRIIVLATQN